MIDEISVKNLALIASAHLAPGAHLSVITGETGSGKTALVEGLKLLAGERGSATQVRDGAEALEVSGRVFVDDGSEDGHVIVRSLSSSGRGRVSIDGAMATVAELASGLGATVDLCGQHEHQRLLSPANHLALVDDFEPSALEAPKAAWDAAFAEARAAQRELARVRSLARASNEALDEAAFVLSRIDAVAPKEGELDELRARLRVAEHADELLSSLVGAREALSGDEGAIDALSLAISALRDQQAHDPALREAADSLENALFEAEDVAATLRDRADAVEIDPEELERLRERQAALQGLVRTYGPSLEDVIERREKAAALVEASRDSSALLAKARERVRSAEAVLQKAADELDEARQALATRFAGAVNAQLESLEMKGAEVLVTLNRLERRRWSAQGPSTAELLYRANQNVRPRPLAKVASGGEVSRVMLAIKVVEDARAAAETIVFDEVDAGVGGHAARSLARVIQTLAKDRQVICVTHLAQVAALAERHYVVAKEQADAAGIPETRLVEVVGEEREAEIARMLAGSTTEASLAHARELLGESEAR